MITDTVSGSARFDPRHYALPPLAVAKLQGMMDDVEEARVLANAATERTREATERATHWQGQARRLGAMKRRELRSQWDGDQEEPPAQLSQAEREYAIHDADARRLNERAMDATRVLQERRDPLTALQGWLREHRSERFQAWTGTVPSTPRRGETVAQALARTREEIAQLRAELHRIASAPLTSVEAKAAIRREIEALAEAAAPDVGPTLEGQGIRWPGPRALAYAGSETTVWGESRHLDVRGLLAWLMKGPVLTRLEADLDAIADDANALSTVQRRAEDARVRREMLALERIEEALIEATSPSLAIPRRPTADPRAVLGLADTVSAYAT